MISNTGILLAEGSQCVTIPEGQCGLQPSTIAKPDQHTAQVCQADDQRRRTTADQS